MPYRGSVSLSPASTLKTLLQSQGSPSGINVEPSDTGTPIFSSTSLQPVNNVYYSSSASYSFINLSPTLYNLRNAEHCYIKCQTGRWIRLR